MVKGASFHDDHGAVLIHVALGLLAIMALSAFAVDHGMLMASRRQAQNAADAAALAGAGALAFDGLTQAEARDMAISVAGKNLVWGAEASIVNADVTFPPCPPGIPPFGNSIQPPTCVRVELFRNQTRGNQLPMVFGHLIGLTGQNIRATATAMVAPGSPPFALDEDAIDNGAPPNYFSASAVNDDIVALGQRQELRYWNQNPGTEITLGSGQPGDEGWFAIEQTPQTWKDTGPTTDGAKNWWLAGPGLGSGSDPEKYLDKVPNVNPFDGSELSLLIGRFVCAIVPDGDVSMNYSPTLGNLKGSTNGTVAMTVIAVTPRGGGYYPWVTVRIEPLSACGSNVSDLGKVQLVR